jgi:hypothetical protein
MTFLQRIITKVVLFIIMFFIILFTYQPHFNLNSSDNGSGFLIIHYCVVGEMCDGE